MRRALTACAVVLAASVGLVVVSDRDQPQHWPAEHRIQSPAEQVLDRLWPFN